MRFWRFVLVSVLWVSASPAATRVRVIAAPSEPARLQGLGADVLLLQDFLSTDAGTFGPGFHICRDERASSTRPNGIVSRYPIAECGGLIDPEVKDRWFDYAKIPLRDGKTLWAFSVHLSDAGEATRLTEAEELAGFIYCKVPVSDYLVIGGRLNAVSDREPGVRVLRDLLESRRLPEGLVSTAAGARHMPVIKDFLLPE